MYWLCRRLRSMLRILLVCGHLQEVLYIGKNIKQKDTSFSHRYNPYKHLKRAEDGNKVQFVSRFHPSSQG